MNVAIRVLDGVLRDDFGFKHIMFVYSGRRGMHCHVADEEARMLTDEQRKAVVDYIDALNGEATGAAGAAAAAKEAAAAGGHGGGAGGAAAGHTNINKVLNSLTVPLHPALR
jgi:DNA primase catalytic subunit